MSTRDKIKETAADNARLLKTISEKDYSPSALQQSNNYIINLKKDVAAQEKLLKDTQLTVQRERAEHIDYQSSHIKRMAYRIGGKGEKFQEKASKEEKDWVEAVQREIEVGKKLNLLKQNLADATQTSADLEKVVSAYTNAQEELDALYRSIFEGPTPDISGEDSREDAVKHAAANFDSAQSHVNKEKQVRSILADANRFMKMAHQDIEDARSSAKADAFGFGGVFMEMAESNAISRVRQNVGQVEMLLSQARMIQPAVGELGDVVHAQQNFMSDVLFDNVFSDVSKYEKIKDSKASLVRAQQNLNGITQASDNRLQAAMGGANLAKQEVDRLRAELQQFRSNAYEDIIRGTDESAEVTGKTPEGPPPSYQP